MNDHHFNVRVAIDFDPETAIFLNNMAFWLNITAANREHYYEGHYWLYNSYTQWSEIFPYWSSKQMRRIIDNAVKNGLLMKGCFNLKRYDNTNWYTFTDKALGYYPFLKEQLLYTPAQTGKTPAQTGKTPAQTGRPIPYSNTYNNPECVGENPTHTQFSLKNLKKEEAGQRALSSPKIKERFERKFKGLDITLEQLFEDCQEHYEQKNLWTTESRLEKWVDRENVENYKKVGTKVSNNETHEERLKRYAEESKRNMEKSGIKN